MKDLSYKQPKPEYEPNGVEIMALIIVTVVWLVIFIGAML